MNKTALITGASSGLGYEFAKVYAENGYNLVIVARREARLFDIKKELEEKYHHNVWVFACDLSKLDAAYEVFNFTLEHQFDIEVLINNAGFGDYGNFAEYDREKQDQLLQVNIVTLVQLTRYFLPQMIKRNSGQIINMSSVAAFCAGPKMSLYYASKAFVLSFTEAIAEELKNSKVHVLALCPGPTATEFDQAAGMKNSKMFTFFKPQSAKEVALSGYIACQNGKVLKYCGITKPMNILTRLMPRSITRKFSQRIN